ncbi:MAG: DUF4126 domain-containing protein [Prolixibacteraceae bacterium]|nr:DUF4126 domain-containing protein [Prolixibacteraceae bacterium]
MEREIIIGVALGIGLSASAGFRVFLPLLITALAARFDLISLNESFAWLSSTAALISLSAATVVEIIAYYVPFVDNLLDALAMPLAIGAGTILAASVFPVDQGFLKWIMAFIIGGGASATVHGGTSLLRLTSTGTTGGLGNPVVTTGENVAAIGIPLLTIAIPLIMVIIVIFLLTYILRKIFKKRARRKRL